MIPEETRQRVLKGKSQRQKLEVESYWALTELSNFFGAYNKSLMYQVNKLLNGLDVIRQQGKENENGKGI